MSILGQDNNFWIAVMGAATVRLLTAEYKGPWWARLIFVLSTYAIAIFSAMIFVDPLLHAMALPPDTYKVPMSALVAVTGHSVMKMLINVSWSQIMDAIRAWRGGK